MSLDALTQPAAGSTPYAVSYESEWPISNSNPAALGFGQVPLGSYSRTQPAGLGPVAARPQPSGLRPQSVGLRPPGSLRPVVATPPAVPGAVDVLALSDRLASCPDLTSLLRVAVQLLRTEVGLERAAIYLDTPDGRAMTGSFGTGLRGELTDERHACYQKGSQVHWAHQQADSGRARWSLFPDAPHVAHVDGEPVVFGRGWLAITPIRVGSVPVGVVYNDCAFSGRVVDEDRQRKAVLFCALLGHLIRARQTHWTQWPTAGNSLSSNQAFSTSAAGQAPAPNTPETEPEYATNNAVINRALECLRKEPQLTGAALSKLFGLSDGHLARLFKAETGVSMVEHRNRLRLRRFLELARAKGANLSDAATDAGFGSYAQFHRVFRATFGNTPREYLASQSCH